MGAVRAHDECGRTMRRVQRPTAPVVIYPRPGHGLKLRVPPTALGPVRRRRNRRRLLLAPHEGKVGTGPEPRFSLAAVAVALRLPKGWILRCARDQGRGQHRRAVRTTNTRQQECSRHGSRYTQLPARGADAEPVLGEALSQAEAATGNDGSGPECAAQRRAEPTRCANTNLHAPLGQTWPACMPGSRPAIPNRAGICCATACCYSMTAERY